MLDGLDIALAEDERVDQRFETCIVRGQITDALKNIIWWQRSARITVSLGFITYLNRHSIQ